jgi:hypothetical protein
MARTSKFIRYFQHNELPLLGGTIYLVPQLNTYPNGALVLTEDWRPGFYYREGVPDGEYQIWININDGSGLNKYDDNIWVGENWLSQNSQFKGVAVPLTNPGTPVGSVWYLASQPGTYIHFGGITVTAEIAILQYNGTSWLKSNIWSLTSIPIQGSRVELIFGNSGYIYPADHGLGSVILVGFFLVNPDNSIKPYQLSYTILSNGTIEWYSTKELNNAIAIIK